MPFCLPLQRRHLLRMDAAAIWTQPLCRSGAWGNVLDAVEIVMAASSPIGTSGSDFQIEMTTDMNPGRRSALVEAVSLRSEPGSFERGTKSW